MGWERERCCRYYGRVVFDPCVRWVCNGSNACSGAYEDLKYVVPELQKRGIFHKDYEGATLRDNLGLNYPAPSHWKIPMPNGGH